MAANAVFAFPRGMDTRPVRTPLPNAPRMMRFWNGRSFTGFPCPYPFGTNRCDSMNAMYRAARAVGSADTSNAPAVIAFFGPAAIPPSIPPGGISDILPAGEGLERKPSTPTPQGPAAHPVQTYGEGPAHTRLRGYRSLRPPTTHPPSDTRSAGRTRLHVQPSLLRAPRAAPADELWTLHSTSTSCNLIGFPAALRRHAAGVWSTVRSSVVLHTEQKG